uniref:Uncharacterized protein n=1 Tax=Trichuris muris TaxID=70415 RepID=A0A5S6Q8T2_TRIMR
MACTREFSVQDGPESRDIWFDESSLSRYLELNETSYGHFNWRGTFTCSEIECTIVNERLRNSIHFFVGLDMPDNVETTYSNLHFQD